MRVMRRNVRRAKIPGKQYTESMLPKVLFPIHSNGRVPVLNNIGASYFSSLNGTNGYDNCRINKAFIKELRWTPSKTDTFGIALTVHPGEVSALETDDVP